MATVDTASRVERITTRMLKFDEAEPSSANDNDYSDAHLTLAIESVWVMVFKPVFLAAGWDVGSIDYPTTEASTDTAERKEINEAVAQVVAYDLLSECPEVDLHEYGPGSEIWKKRKQALGWLAMVENGKRSFAGISRMAGDLPSGPILSDPPGMFKKRDNAEGDESDTDDWPLLHE